MIRKSLMFTLLLIFALLISTNPYLVSKTFAAAQRSHFVVSYERTGWGNNLQGGYVYSSVPNITSYWSSTNSQNKERFILKSMWTHRNGDGNAWIENGFMDGADKNYNYYKGFYYAWGDLDDTTGSVIQYDERKVTGPNTTVGTAHAHKTWYIGNNYWRTQIDWSNTLDIYGWAGDGRMDVGIEANNPISTLNSVTTVSDLAYYEDGVWNDWDTNAKINTNDYWLLGINVEFTNATKDAAKWYK